MGRPDKYKNDYPSVTTIIGLLTNLQWWYGAKGTAYCERVKRESAEIGHHVHDAFEKFLRSGSFDEAAQGLTNQETTMLLRFVEWANEVKPKILMLEGKLVDGPEGEGLFSDTYQFAGTPDCVCVLKHKVVMADWKTDSTPKKKADVAERRFKYGLQLAAYAIMYQERNQVRINNGIIVRCDKEAFFETIVFDDLRKHKKLFLMLREIYRELKGK